jgi:hypothetical protein
METWWISPALVGLGIAVNLILAARRDARHQGVIDTQITDLDGRLDRHSSAINDLHDARISHGERISALESWRKEHGTHRG